MHDWGDMLVHAGFAEPVMDMERIVLTWPTPEAALAELRDARAQPASRRVSRRCAAEAGATRCDAALAELAPAGEDDGRIALTFEIIYGHAFKPAPRVALAAESARLAARHARRCCSAGAPAPESAPDRPATIRRCVNSRVWSRDRGLSDMGLTAIDAPIC